MVAITWKKEAGGVDLSQELGPLGYAYPPVEQVHPQKNTQAGNQQQHDHIVLILPGALGGPADVNAGGEHAHQGHQRVNGEGPAQKGKKKES